MHIVPTNFAVADYCEAMDRGDIIVNRDYQRSDKVWPPAAKSFLIETILLGYPIPKLALYQKTDLKSKRVFKEIVDGQQRSIAILDYFHDRYRLASTVETPEFVGLKYSDLPEEHQQKFIDYSLAVDLFVSATPEDIREIFRRMNSYTVPLNPEERRHASYQGTFKWFVYRLTRANDQRLLSMGIFTQNQMVRMADTKLLAEISHALLFGIQTTKSGDLDELYDAKDKSFPEHKELEARINNSIDTLASFQEVHNTALMKPYNVYALLLAITHLQKPAAQLQKVYPIKRSGKINRDNAVAALSLLNDALQNPEHYEKYEDFVEACAEQTNVAEQRVQRFNWFCKAVAGKL